MTSHRGEKHDVYRTDLEHLMLGRDDLSYHFTAKDGITQLEMHGKKINHAGKQTGIMIDGLFGRRGSSVRATDAYIHMMKHHGLTIISDKSQTSAGAKVWDKLVKHPDVHSAIMKPLRSYRTKPKDDVPISTHNGSKWALLPAAKERIYHERDPSRIYAYMKRDKK